MKESNRMIAAGMNRRVYTSDNACAMGHVMRYTASGNCVECSRVHCSKRTKAIAKQRNGPVGLLRLRADWSVEGITP